MALIAKYAEFEFKFGELERGVTLFEALVSANTKRLDLWFVYIDMCAKMAQLQRARSVLLCFTLTMYCSVQLLLYIDEVYIILYTRIFQRNL